MGERLIDALHLGREHVIGCWLVDDVLIDPGPGSCLDTVLAGLDGVRPRALLLTHIHLDHAGASGSLVERWPELEVYVHEIGAPHLIDPGRLIDSAKRLYKDDMDRLWGEMVPVPEANIRELRGGERLLDGRFEVAYTPGHASHHVSYLCDGTAFVGDVGGVRIGSGLTIPPTPPPDIDVDAWLDSIDRIEARTPTAVVLTHFGRVEDVAGQLQAVREALRFQADLARDKSEDEFVAAMEAAARERVDESTGERLLDAGNPHDFYAGLKRYWSKVEAA